MAKIFDRDRFGFCIIGGNICVMRRCDRDLPTLDWMRDVLGMGDDAEYAIRGYFTPDRIQFFASDYTTSAEVKMENIIAARAAHKRLYGVSVDVTLGVPVYNGVKDGVKEGVEGETWPPFLKWNDDTEEWEVV
jgi:hypothetical protein